MVTIRDLARHQLAAAAALVHDAFLVLPQQPYEPTTPHRARHYGSPCDALFTTAALALDLEKRCTPWDWASHRQYVATADDDPADILGFAELWFENRTTEDALAVMERATPQPCVFNVAVAQRARRAGVATALVRRCEQQAREWDAPQLYLSVAPENAAAIAVYERLGFAEMGTRESRVPAWLERWKGSVPRLSVMRKRVAARPADSARRPAPAAADASELSVTLERVLSYDDRDALIWFGLLVLRNIEALSPLYAAVGLGAATAGVVTYLAIAAFVNPQLIAELRSHGPL